MILNQINWKDEIVCGPVELAIKRLFTGIFYNRIYRRLHPEQPWLTPGAIKAIKRRLNAGSKVFEYGSGKSTVWLARNCSSIVSVENDPEWYHRIKSIIEEEKINAVIILAENNRSDFEKYENLICNYEDGYFDIILVDGRSRMNCLKNSIRKIHKHGIIVLDDSQRPRYAEADKIMAQYRRRDYNFGIKRTTIWFAE